MNPALRKIAFGVALVLPVLAACDRDKTRPAADILAQDSTLNLAVMTANQDSLSAGNDDSQSVAARSTTVSSADPVRTSRPVVSPRDQATVSPAAAPAVSQPRIARVSTKSARRMAATSSRSARRVRLASSVRPTRSSSNDASITRPTGRRRARTVWQQSAATAPTTGNSTVASVDQPAVLQPAPRRAFATIPTGSDFTLASDQKICMNSTHVGDRFTGRLAEDLVAPNGAVIPKGSLAVGEVSSVNDGIDVSFSSLTVGGRSYPVGSRVTYVQLDRVRTSSAPSASRVVAAAGIGAILGRVIGGNTRSTIIGAAGGAVAGGVLASRAGTYQQCVPAGGRISAVLTEPLRVASTE